MDSRNGQLIARFADLGIDAEISVPSTAKDKAQHGALNLARGASAQAFELLDGPEMHLASVLHGTSARPPFVHTPHIAARTGDAFRRAGVQYLDDAGNAWIQFGDVLIDVRGRPRRGAATTPARTSGNLFSSGRAQVVFTLLAWPDLWHAPQRELAQAAGVSLGQAHNALALLKQAGYGADSTRTGRTNLLDLWAAAFPSGLGQRLSLASFNGEVSPLKTPNKDLAMAVSGEAAVPDLLKATALTLYISELTPRLAIVNRWRTDGEPNIVVRRKFWTSAGTSDPQDNGVEVAPWQLVYADLLASDDPRARAAAQEFRESHE